MIMKQLSIKLKRILKEGIRDLYYFGFTVMLVNVCCIWSNDSTKSIVRRNKVLVQWLTRHFQELLRAYKENVNPVTQNQFAEYPVWVFWWQGREAMPEIIELCYKSKLRAAGTHSVILLTKDNIREYVEFPEYVWQQFEAKKLRIQHLADMIRVQLIAKYGGIWLDASIYCIDNIPEEIYSADVYSLKHEIDEQYVSLCRWTTFVIGGLKNNVLCSFLNEFFVEYCKTGKPFIDYYMFDCAIAVAYNNLPKVQDAIDKLQMSEKSCYWLDEHLSEYWKDTERELKSQGIFQKIAWQQYSNNSFGEDSLYTYLKQKEEEYAKS